MTAFCSQTHPRHSPAELIRYLKEVRQEPLNSWLGAGWPVPSSDSLCFVGCPGTAGHILWSQGCLILGEKYQKAHQARSQSGKSCLPFLDTGTWNRKSGVSLSCFPKVAEGVFSEGAFLKGKIFCWF